MENGSEATQNIGEVKQSTTEKIEKQSTGVDVAVGFTEALCVVPAFATAYLEGIGRDVFYASEQISSVIISLLTVLGYVVALAFVFGFLASIVSLVFENMFRKSKKIKCNTASKVVGTALKSAFVMAVSSVVIYLVQTLVFVGLDYMGVMFSQQQIYALSEGAVLLGFVIVGFFGGLKKTKSAKGGFEELKMGFFTALMVIVPGLPAGLIIGRINKLIGIAISLVLCVAVRLIMKFVQYRDVEFENEKNQNA